MTSQRKEITHIESTAECNTRHKPLKFKYHIYATIDKIFQTKTQKNTFLTRFRLQK